jgi:hypothetical protein
MLGIVGLGSGLIGSWIVAATAELAFRSGAKHQAMAASLLA